MVRDAEPTFLFEGGQMLRFAQHDNIQSCGDVEITEKMEVKDHQTFHAGAGVADR